jgi:hypothetical protein
VKYHAKGSGVVSLAFVLALLSAGDASRADGGPLGIDHRRRSPLGRLRQPPRPQLLAGGRFRRPRRPHVRRNEARIRPHATDRNRQPQLPRGITVGWKKSL